MSYSPYLTSPADYKGPNKYIKMIRKAWKDLSKKVEK